MSVHLVIALASFLVALLTLFSGFGLGTLLLPAFAIFFPAEVAVAATALVHIANNLFKIVLLGRHAKLGVLLRFGLPAAAAAIPGALLLARASELPVLVSWRPGGTLLQITAINLVLAVLIAAFAVLELRPRFRHLALPARYLVPGGLVSGFFGGLSGHQGALRAAFLAKAGLTRDQFVATGAGAVVLVDLARLAVYGTTFFSRELMGTANVQPSLLGTAILAALAGSFLASRMLPRVTLSFIQTVVGVGLLLLALALGLGLL